MTDRQNGTTRSEPSLDLPAANVDPGCEETILASARDRSASLLLRLFASSRNGAPDMPDSVTSHFVGIEGLAAGTSVERPRSSAGPSTFAADTGCGRERRRPRAGAQRLVAPLAIQPSTMGSLPLDMSPRPVLELFGRELK